MSHLEGTGDAKARIVFTDTGTWLASTVLPGESHKIPETLIQRSSLLADMRGDGEDLGYEVQLPFSMADAQSWLLCAELAIANDADLVTRDYQTLLGALTVRDSIPKQASRFPFICSRIPRCAATAPHVCSV